MAQLANAITVMFVSFLMVSHGDRAIFRSTSNVCRICNELIHTPKFRNEVLRVISKSRLDNRIEFDVLKYCMDMCNNMAEVILLKKNTRRKRDSVDGIYKYFSLPFPHMADRNMRYEVHETVDEDPQELQQAYIYGENGYPNLNYVNPSEVLGEEGISESQRSLTHPGEAVHIEEECNGVREQEESVKRILAMFEESIKKIIDYIRGSIREEVRVLQKTAVPPATTFSWLIGLQQNNIFLPASPSQPLPKHQTTTMDVGSSRSEPEDADLVQSTSEVPVAVETTESLETNSTMIATTTFMPTLPDIVSSSTELQVTGQKLANLTELATERLPADPASKMSPRQNESDCGEKPVKRSFLPALLEVLKSKTD